MTSVRVLVLSMVVDVMVWLYLWCSFLFLLVLICRNCRILAADHEILTYKRASFNLLMTHLRRCNWVRIAFPHFL